MRSEARAIGGLADELAAVGARACPVAVVLGSGLGAFVERLSDARVLPYADCEHAVRSTIPGHAGRFVLGELAGVSLLVQEGRVHLYEGRSAREVTRAVRAFGALGVRAVVFTNAAGSMVRAWGPGELMRIEDHLNLQARPALDADERGLGAVYDGALGRVLDAAARTEGIGLHRGVYAGLLGPSYETPAEIRMLAGLGAHAVGMSTVTEAVAARAAGMRVAAVSCLSNHAAGLADEVLRHEDVLAAGRVSAERLVRLLGAALPELGRASAAT